MNTQDILRHGRTKLDVTLDVSEFYDFELVNDVLGKVDIVLDYSEFYDFTLGDNSRDYIYFNDVADINKLSVFLKVKRI